MDNFAANILTRTSPSQATILIVDDDPSNLASLGALLQEHFNVLAAPSGDRAMRIAGAAQKPDLILLDVLMPHLGGYEVITALHNHLELKRAREKLANQNAYLEAEVVATFIAGFEELAAIAETYKNGAFCYE